MEFMGGKPVPLLVLYPLFSEVWAWASWRFLPPIDGARKGIAVFADVAMRALAGVFVIAPAFAMWQSAKFNEDSGGAVGGHTEGHRFSL
jgi:hypothetical protein